MFLKRWGVNWIKIRTCNRNNREAFMLYGFLLFIRFSYTLALLL